MAPLDGKKLGQWRLRWEMGGKLAFASRKWQGNSSEMLHRMGGRVV